MNIGVIYVSNSPDKANIPGSIIDLSVSDIFRKNGINLEDGKGKLSAEEKQQIKDLVNDLRKQVDAFVKKDASPDNVKE
jgi:spore coat protein W